MKVIFVIQGEGRGHLTQALALKQMLLHEDHEVVKVLVGKSKNRVIPEFFMNQIGSPIELFDSPNFLPSKDNRKFNLLRSLIYNTLLAPSYLSSIHLIWKNIQESGADIIINFYEVLCGITCSLFRFGIPEVCIGHQYLFLHPSFQMPGKYPVPESLLKFFTRITCMGATAKLALSIRDYEDEPVHGIKVVPPLLRQEAKTIIRHHGDYIMGYMLNAGFAEDVKAWHEKHPHTQLHFFWDQPDAPEELKVDDTLSFHRINDEKFLKMMAGCKAFATTAGFESVCEALYMGKPCMLIPAHVEQECNAMDAEREMAGVVSEDFDIDKLKAFARDYEEDVEFRMWENHADTRIIAVIENAYDTYYHRKEKQAYEEENDSIVAASSLVVPARRVWQG
mgnify:FL=1